MDVVAGPDSRLAMHRLDRRFVAPGRSLAKALGDVRKEDLDLEVGERFRARSIGASAVTRAWRRVSSQTALR